MENNLPAAAFGHFIMKVSDINISYQFYTDMGLRPREIFPDLAISNCEADRISYCLVKMVNCRFH